MSTQNELKELIVQLEAGYITREEFEVLKADLVSSKRQLEHSARSSRSVFLSLFGLIALTVVGVSVMSDDSGERAISSAPSGKKVEGYEAVLIRNGTFTMGCTKGDSDCEPNETPVHDVTISKDFYLMKSEVTQGLYNDVMGTNPSRYKACGSACPVERVSWFDAVKFANAFSKK